MQIRTSFLTCVMLIVIIPCFAQQRILHLIKDGKPNYWYEWVSTKTRMLALDSIPYTTFPNHFRVWSTSQVIEVWQANDGGFNGQLITWTKESVPENEEPTNRIYIQKEALDLPSVQNINSLIVSSGINTIPTEDSITGWSQGFDGVEYIIETADSKSYYLKSYWTPRAQDPSLEEASIVQKFVDQVFQAGNANAAWKNFIATVPFECSTNGSGTMCNILTPSTKRKMKKERAQYRAQKAQ